MRSTSVKSQTFVVNIMMSTHKSHRRQFLKETGSVAIGFAGLHRFFTSAASAQPYQNQIDHLGKLLPDPQRIMDLPDGFTYKVLSSTGDMMSDGLKTPGSPDGMGAFAGENGEVIIVRNHELEDQKTFDGAFGITNELLDKVDPKKMYDSGKGIQPQLGGTSTIVYDPENREVIRSFMSLAGTSRNCAGGPTPWGSWITCEETVFRPKSKKEVEDETKAEEKKAKKEAEKTEEERAREKADRDAYLAKLSPKRRKQTLQDEVEKEQQKKQLKDQDYFEQWHGYNFEVPASSEMKLVDPVPLKEMGRFNHEAVAVDPASGVVYQTEDRDDSLITRYVPKSPGNLSAGGKLQALVIKGNESCDTRNWPGTGEPIFPIGEAVDIEWMDLEDIDSPKDDLRKRGYDQGAAIFARGEGMWYGNGKIYFACTSGGIAQSGQVFIYQPSTAEGTPEEANKPGKLTLYLEPNNTQLLQYGDNLTIAPWGDIVLCEDGVADQYLRGITPDGKIYTLGRSGYEGNVELCGACFAPNHDTLFVNIQRPGITLAITGPWKKLSENATA
jgi:secreted PhoX family phosphatase